MNSWLAPVNNSCIDCGKTVAISDRQEIAVDEKGQIRRRCDKCIQKFDQGIKK